MRDVHEELRARLREAGRTHEPDRARILARVEHGMAGDARPERPERPPLVGWARVVGATTAVAGLLTVGGYAVASAVKGDEQADQTVAVSPTPTPDATLRPPVKPDPTPRPTSRTGSPIPPPRAPRPPRTPPRPGHPPPLGGDQQSQAALIPHRRKGT